MVTVEGRTPLKPRATARVDSRGWVQFGRAEENIGTDGDVRREGRSRRRYAAATNGAQGHVHVRQPDHAQPTEQRCVCDWTQACQRPHAADDLPSNGLLGYAHPSIDSCARGISAEWYVWAWPNGYVWYGSDPTQCRPARGGVHSG